MSSHSMTIFVWIVFAYEIDVLIERINQYAINYIICDIFTTKINIERNSKDEQSPYGAMVAKSELHDLHYLTNQLRMVNMRKSKT